jgi:hypothetical protein
MLQNTKIVKRNKPHVPLTAEERGASLFFNRGEEAGEALFTATLGVVLVGGVMELLFFGGRIGVVV